MDDVARAILKEILPQERAVRPPKPAKVNREDQLDHLAAPLLLERAAYLHKLAKLGEGSASEVLKEYPGHAIHLLVRNRNGCAEQHARFADLFFVLEGRASLATGGMINHATTIAPGEIRGNDLEGCTLQELRAGDVAHVPAGLPHQMRVSGDTPVTCMVVKIEQDQQSTQVR